MTLDPRITTALANLGPGGWSLTVLGFAARAMKIRDPSARDRAMLRDQMNATGLPMRRVKIGDEYQDVWDLQK